MKSGNKPGNGNCNCGTDRPRTSTQPPIQE